MPDEIKLDLHVDLNNLGEAWQNQAALMFEYSTMLADAQWEEDKAKANLSVIAAGLDRDIRSDPEAYDLAKATETTVPGCVAEQPEHKVATKKLNNAKHRVRLLRAAVDAISHRKSTLQGMTDLWLRQWYADPTARKPPAEPELDGEAQPGGSTKSTTRRRRRRDS